MKRKFCDIVGLAPFALALIKVLDIVPAQYDSILIFAIVVCAILCCVAYFYFPDEAFDISGLPALLCVFYGANTLYDLFNYNFGTFWSVFEGFCIFICGIGYFSALLERRKNK